MSIHPLLILSRKYNPHVWNLWQTQFRSRRQRIAIARAVRRAPIVILDEPTTGLDSDNEREVTAALDRLTRSRTTILITHNLHAVMEADQVLYLAGGWIVEQGSHTELMARDGACAAVYRWQANGDSLGQADFALHEARRHSPSADWSPSNPAVLRGINGG